MDASRESNALSKDEAKKQNLKVSEDERSYWEMMIDGIVRPPRAKYQESQLGKF